MLSVKYSVDPTVDGKVTIQTPNPVTKAAAVELFQSALRTNNSAIINSNGTYKIVSADQAAIGANIQIQGEADPTARLGSSLRIVPLKYVTASEIRRVLEPIAPRGAIVRVDDTRNIITLSGNDQDIRGMMDAISVFDVDVMKGMSFALGPVRTSQPSAIADELRTIFSSDREGPMAGMV
ncbi:MAG TPA: secretin N-terminal domain-containing protein [Xanthobacteraceae bacterium]|jgi:general secretion pathway protein D|nr:secretin N-terminal domain-containing protein [Xanthobacteraceae bacterium]